MSEEAISESDLEPSLNSEDDYLENEEEDDMEEDEDDIDEDDSGELQISSALAHYFNFIPGEQLKKKGKIIVLLILIEVCMLHF